MISFYADQITLIQNNPTECVQQTEFWRTLAKCRHHEICGRDALEGTGEGLCILHSRNTGKDTEAFSGAFIEHVLTTSDPSFLFSLRIRISMTPNSG
jgi:hypothetical protein